METQTPVNGQENICWLKFCDIFKLTLKKSENGTCSFSFLTLLCHLVLPYLLIFLLILAVCSPPPPLPDGSILHTSCGVMSISMFFRPLLLSASVLKVIITQVTTERNYSATLSYAYWLSFITYGLLTHIPVQHSSLRTSFMQPFNGPVFKWVVAVNYCTTGWCSNTDWKTGCLIPNPCS